MPNAIILKTQKAQDFAVTLGKRANIKVHIVDERLTTKAAREFIYDNFGYLFYVVIDFIHSFTPIIFTEHRS
jgi:RNase H-fold protein (predicted Holliday junction resolvase)